MYSYTVKSLSDALAARELSSVEATALFLKRINRLNARYNCFVALDPACSELWDKEKKGYKFFKSNPGKILSPEEEFARPPLVGAIGAAVERYGLRPVHKNGHVAELLFTFGLAFANET